MNQNGRSMIEMLGVLAIIGVLSVGGISGYTKAMTKHKTNSTAEIMLTIATNIQGISLRSKNYPDDLTAVAKKVKAIPNKALSGSNLVNPFGGSIQLGGFGKGSIKKYFYVAMNGLPKNACMELATGDYGSALVYAGSGIFSNSVSGLANQAPENLKQSGAVCNNVGAAGAYCLKQVMSPTLATKGCNCTNAGGCNVAIVMF